MTKKKKPEKIQSKTKDMSALCRKAYKIIDRLSYLLVEKELQCEKLAKYISNSRKNGGDNAK